MEGIGILVGRLTHRRSITVFLGILSWIFLAVTNAWALQQERRVAAVRSSEPIVLDGNLDDPAWELAAAAEDFIQTEPTQGSLTLPAGLRNSHLAYSSQSRSAPM